MVILTIWTFTLVYHLTGNRFIPTIDTVDKVLHRGPSF